MLNRFFRRQKIRIKNLLKLPKFKTVFRWGWKALLLILVMDTGYLIGIWPDWEIYAKGPIQQSSFIRHYISVRYKHPGWPRLHWNPVPIQDIPRYMQRALIVAEDARFYSHSGIDTEALN
jgi:monofunctional biosynthetic peptidoglycan transglycosylase